jgi:hypothetical protein
VAQVKVITAYLKTKAKRAGEVAWVVEQLSSKVEVLSSKPNTAKLQQSQNTRKQPAFLIFFVLLGPILLHSM